MGAMESRAVPAEHWLAERGGADARLRAIHAATMVTAGVLMVARLRRCSNTLDRARSIPSLRDH